MKPKVVLLLFISFWGFKGLHAQNMVVNPSLEPTTKIWEIQDNLDYYIYLKNWIVDQGSAVNMYISKYNLDKKLTPPFYGRIGKNFQRVLFDDSHVILFFDGYEPRNKKRTTRYGWDYLNGYLKKPLTKNYVYVGASGTIPLRLCKGPCLGSIWK